MDKLKKHLFKLFFKKEIDKYIKDLSNREDTYKKADEIAACVAISNNRMDFIEIFL